MWSTAQIPDFLIIGKDTFSLCNNPLEAYLEQKGSQTIGKYELKWTNTALWRGYIATWELKNDSLFLGHMQDDWGKDSNEINITDEFGSDRVFAHWVTDTLRCLQGEIIQYVHDGYASIYEGDKFYAFEQGKLKGTKSLNYLERDENRLFPGEYFLTRFLMRKIIKSINTVDRKNLDESILTNSLTIRFNKKGKISYVGYEEGLGWGGKARKPQNINEEIILRNAKKALKGLPRLMKVNHKWYRPHKFSLRFSEHCLKHPEDKEYGCSEEEYSL